MSDRKSRFNLFRFNKRKNNLNWSDDGKRSSLSDDTKNDDLSFPSFDSIIPENSPLKKNSNSSSGFYNDDFKSKKGFDASANDEDLEGVDEKYAKYIFADDSNHFDFENPRDYNSYEDANDSGMGDSLDFDGEELNGDGSYINDGNLKQKLLKIKKSLLNKNNSSKTLFGKITFVLIFLVLFSSIFYFFVYQPFQNELSLEKNSKLNEVNALRSNQQRL